MLLLTPDDVRAVDAAQLELLLRRTDATVAFGDGEVRGFAAAALLFADYAVVAAGATLLVDTPAAWAGVVWRLGRKALAWQVQGARIEDVVDETTEADPGSWLEEWMRHRSTVALDTAARLIRCRGGDALEREEFARLFALGEPQRGLGAFLAKERPSYSSDREKP